MQQLLTILHILVAVCLIVLVLIQHGKGADVGATFGSGASNTMFGSQGATPFLVKLTGILALIFFTTSLLLSLIVSKIDKPVNVLTAPTAPIPVETIPVNNNAVAPASPIPANTSVPKK
jgi:preprotein translocase subunit SecG